MSIDWNGPNVWRNLSARTIFLHQAIGDRFGLNLTDHKCLDILVQHGPLTAGKLAEASGLTTGAITGVVDRLEGMNFVVRTADSADRRKTIIVVLPERLEELSRVFRDLAARTEAVMASYTSQERAAINDFAEKTGAMIVSFVAELKARR